jgi:hypothetical protein
VPNLPGDLYYLSINSYMQGVAQHPSNENTSTVITVMGSLKNAASISSGTSILVLSLLIVTLVAVSMVWFSKFEYVPREDAE